MLVISTNVLIKHHESKTGEGQHFKKRRHKLVFLSNLRENLETKVLFFKVDLFNLSCFDFLWPFSTTFITICTKCPLSSRSSAWTQRRTKRRFNDTPRRLIHIFKFDLSPFCLPSLKGVRRKTILSVQKAQVSTPNPFVPLDFYCSTEVKEQKFCIKCGFDSCLLSLFVENRLQVFKSKIEKHVCAKTQVLYQDN